MAAFWYLSFWQVQIYRLGSNLSFFSRFSQPAHFFRFKPDHLLLNRARFSGDNDIFGRFEQVQTCINMQVSPDNPINSP